jgi:UDP-N-acetylglucosamine pyrophosphorylase
MNDKEYKEWERQIEEAKTHNNKLLIEFENHLKTKSLKTNTIKNHIDNVKFYANDFLLRYEIIPVEKGILQIGSFLGDFFIRKASWASKYTIQENIASFKKFYSFLNEIGKVSKIELAEMKELIKDEKSDWIEEVENYWDNIENDW